MAKKKIDLGAAMGATVEKIFEVPASVSTAHDADASNTTASKEVSAQTSTGAKRGRPAATTAPDEVNVTFRLSKSLIQDIRVKAVMEQTTQKEIVDAALRQYLNK